MPKSSPKIAVFYDWLNHPCGGAEKVLIDILTVFPQADLYTLVYNPQKTHWLPKKTKIFTSFVDHLPFAKNNPIFYTPFYTPALKMLNLSSYDIVISTTSTIGHQLPISKNQLFVCYFHNINRYLYQIPPTILRPLLWLYQIIDKKLSQKPRIILCNSKTVQKRIQHTYHRLGKVVYPGVDADKFIPTKNPSKKFCLVVSRLVPHKNIKLAILACQKQGIPLKIVGTGRHQNYLQKISANTTEFLGNIDTNQLIKLYQNCLCLIHPQIEDLGLSCLEAQSCGRPVIALKIGGATETVIDGQTGLFFNKPNLKSLARALKKIKYLRFDPKICRQNALQFSRQNFMLHFKKIVSHSWSNHISS